MFPVVNVSGTARERGRQYGEWVRDRIHVSISSYAQVYQLYAGWDWATAKAEAQRFVSPIADFAPSCLEEMVGIADGAGVTFEDVLAINVRTEVMNAARVGTALALPAPGECSVFASVRSGGVLAGQNWDWLPFAAETVVVLRSQPDDGPAFVTVVEAGLLAKFGVNAAGLAVLTNALSCSEDEAKAAVPYHVLLRSLLGCRTTNEAVGVVDSAPRASSANYLLVDGGGHAVNLEVRPGGVDKIHRMRPDSRGVLLHTNHFVSADFDATDYADLVPSTSRRRLDRSIEVTAGAADLGDADTFTALMTDHSHAPNSVCRHLIPGVARLEQTVTVASVVIDLGRRKIILAHAQPCRSGYHDVAFPSKMPTSDPPPSLGTRSELRSG